LKFLEVVASSISGSFSGLFARAVLPRPFLTGAGSLGSSSGVSTTSLAAFLPKLIYLF
jgi:hypothetical protein